MARVMKQDRGLREKFQQRIDQKVQADKEAKKELVKGVFGDFPFYSEGIVDFALTFREAKNQLKGDIGEFVVSLAANTLSDDWIIFNDVILEPAPDVLTQIDHVFIGKPGIFLVETKAWRGSFTGYRDNWKRREGKKWVQCSSPTAQSARHADAVCCWVRTSNLPARPEEWIIPLVVFTQAQWLRTTDCSTEVFDGVSPLINYLHNQRATKLTFEQVNQIAEMLANPTVPQSTSSATPKPKPKVKQPQRYDPEKAEGYHTSAMEKAKRGRYQEANEDFTLALKYNSTSAVTYKYRGIARSRLSNNTGAIEDFQAAINLYQELGQSVDSQELKERIAKLQTN